MLIVLALLAIQPTFSQKEGVRVIDASNAKSIELDASAIFQVNVTVHDSQEVIITTRSEGEFSADVVITHKTRAERIVLGTAFQPAFKDHNDKLSAHKVVSFAMDLQVPKDKILHIESAIANVYLEGSLPIFKAYLQSGFCKLKGFYGEAEVVTQKGAIELLTNSGIIQGESKNGKVTIDAMPMGDNKISLKTIDGDIRVIRTQ